MSQQQPPMSTGSGQSEEWQKAEAIAETLMPQQAQAIKAVASLIMIFLGWLAGSVEPFIRYNFGERYYGVLRIFFIFNVQQLFILIVAGITSLNNRVNNFLGGEHIPFATMNQAYIFAFLALSIAHRLHMGWRNAQRIEWYSHSFGISWIARLIDIPGLFAQIGLPVSHMTADWFLYRWIEPAICYAIGGYIYSLEPITGTWLQVSAVALFLKNQMHYYGYYNAVLDARDAAILSKAILADARGEDLPKWEKFGVTGIRQAAEVVTPAMHTQTQATVNPILKVVKPADHNGDSE